MDDTKPVRLCSICGVEYRGHGNNADPNQRWPLLRQVRSHGGDPHAHRDDLPGPQAEGRLALRSDPALDLARDGHADQIGARLALAGNGVDIRHHARRDRKHQPQIVKLRPAAGLALSGRLLALRVAFFARFTRSLEVISYIRNCPKPLNFL